MLGSPLFALHLVDVSILMSFQVGGGLQETTISGEGPDKVLLIDISGPLTTSKDSGLFSEPSLPARLKEELTKAEEDDHIKAIVLRINTPGGNGDILGYSLS